MSIATKLMPSLLFVLFIPLPTVADTITVPLPPGWHKIEDKKLDSEEIAHTGGVGRIAGRSLHHAPGGQSLDDWTESVVLQRLQKVSYLTLNDYLRLGLALTGFLEDCANVTVSGPVPQRGEKYVSLLAEFSCPENFLMERGLYIASKIIEGRKAIYLVHRMWRGPPYTGRELNAIRVKIASWRSWIREVRIDESSGGDR